MTIPVGDWSSNPCSLCNIKTDNNHPSVDIASEPKKAFISEIENDLFISEVMTEEGHDSIVVADNNYQQSEHAAVTQEKESLPKMQSYSMIQSGAIEKKDAEPKTDSDYFPGVADQQNFSTKTDTNIKLGAVDKKESVSSPHAFISLPSLSHTVLSQKGEIMVTSMYSEVFEEILQHVFPQFQGQYYEDDIRRYPLKVIVSHVCEGGSYFWAQMICGKKRNDLLSILDMLANYEGESGSERVDTNDRKAGAQFSDEWFRVWVQRTEGVMSLVHYIDFGNSAWLSYSELIDLPSEYWTIRPAAAPFKLIGTDVISMNLQDFLNKELSLNIVGQEGHVLHVTVNK